MTFDNIEAEQALLGAVLTDNQTFALVSDIIKGEHFAEPLHGRIYDLAASRISKGHLASPVTMKLDLDGDAALREIGGPAYLARMAGAATVSSAREYAKIILEAACRRALHGIAQDTASRLSEGGDSGAVKMGLLHALSRLPEAAGEESSYSLMSAVADAAKQAVSAYRGDTSFLKTGIESLDRIVKGLAPGDCMLIAGATSMGKTSLALEIARHAAFTGSGVAFVSLEMTRQELATRLTAQAARLAYADLRDPEKMAEGDFRKWIEASQKVAQGKMRIIPRHVRDIPAIHSAVQKCGMSFDSGKADLLVIDYAQLVRGSGKSRYEQMTEVSIGIKQMAGMLELPVIALCQLSRDIGHRDDKRPHLFDIKETGQFENDADFAVFCHREEYWLERQGPKANLKGDITEQAKIDWKADLEAVRNKMEIIVRKNRHGRLATAEVFFHAPTMRFAELKTPEMDF